MDDREIQLLKLIPLLQQVLSKAGIHRTRTGADMEITPLQMTALGVIYRKNNLTMSELARELLVIQSAATRLADELAKRGLVKRMNEKNDRRVTRLKITPQGRAAMENLRFESQYLLSLVLKEMRQEEQEELIQGLQAFLNAVQKVEREAILRCEKPECEDIQDAVKASLSTVD